MVWKMNALVVYKTKGDRRAALVVLFVVLLHCAAPSDGRSPKVEDLRTSQVGGFSVALPVIARPKAASKTPPVRYPYIASIAKNTVHHCTGVFIRPNVVLTAAHCVDPRINHPSQLSVRFFFLQSKSQKEEVIKVSKIKMHPNYRGRGAGFNLALVKMVTSSKIATGIQLMDEKELVVKPRETLLSLGWGSTSQSSGSSPQLQKTLLPVLDIWHCLQKMQRPIRASEFCAGSQGQGPCTGDDGGPLLHRGKDAKSDVLVGIATSQLACGSFGRPDVFTRISAYRSWLITEADKL